MARRRAVRRPPGARHPREYFSVWRPRVDPSGEHLAWEGIADKQGFLVLDGREVGSFDELLDGPTFLDPTTCRGSTGGTSASCG
jgi:hypothetical protein